MNKTNITYLAYGLPFILDQTIFSIQSLILQAGADYETFQIVIYTDNPGYFAEKVPADVAFVPLDAATLKTWRGPADYIHRIKTKMLLDVAQKRNTERLLFLDSDTLFITHPSVLFARIQPNQSLMHFAEGPLRTSSHLLHRKIYRRIHQQEFTICGKRQRISGDAMVWNSGVFGLHHENLNLLEDILIILDELYAAYPKHMMEQLAASIILEEKTKLESCETDVLHYWDKKTELQSIVEKAAHSSFAPETTKHYFDEAVAKYKQASVPAAGPLKRLIAKIIGG